MADLVVETPEGVALRFELAGPGTRILAAGIDGLLFALAYLAAILFLALLDLGLEVVLIGGAVILLAAYSFVLSALLGGRTPGKLWTGIRVCDAQGFAPRLSQLFLRALFVPLEAALVLPVPLVWVLIAGTPRRQRLGDLVAGTLVVRERPRRAPREPVPGLAWSTLESRAFPLDPAAARALDGRDLGFLRDLLTRTDLEADARAGLEARAARHYSARVGLARAELSGEAARTFLRELFLLVREARAGGALTPPAGAAAGRGAPRASAPRPR